MPASRQESTRQLPLDMAPPPRLGRADFVVGETNRAAFETVTRPETWPDAVVLLHGPVGSGKSHLARIFSETTGAPIHAAAALGAEDPLALAGAPALVVEAIDAEERDETALFHLLNAARGSGAHVLLTARALPPAWTPRLPDLGSRLRAATPVAIGAPDDDLLRRVLAKLFADRQIAVDPGVVDWSALRIERSLATAGAFVAALDAASLASRRRVGRRLAAEVLATHFSREPELPGLDDDADDGT